ncbi:MAG TPA: iron ABC transporter permease [Kiritimatiellia bacterium]|nr:iron ABC transporter permease [Kiritimatiellia bacterium]HMP00474.1 iron ABC transporter permease [Kiritimatiellia bacterium]HMP97344.1 iron ABC transporter permease [Kiritimatiellia bacterium]
MRTKVSWIIFVIVSLIFGFLFLAPLWMVIRGGFIVSGQFTLEYLFGVFKNPVYTEGLFNSLMLAVGTTSLVTLIAVPLAWLGNKYDFPGKKLVSGLILVPMILPPFVGAIGFQQILGFYGGLNLVLGIEPTDWLGSLQYWGVISLQSLALYPIMYLNVSAALANVDPAMEEAAANLGCRGVKKFFKITLPLIMPGLFAGGTIVFIWSFTELGTPLIMNFTKCASVQVFDALKEIGTNPFPYALVFVMLAMSVTIYLVGKFLLGGKAYAMQSKAATVAGTKNARGLKGLLVLLPFALVIFVALTPHLGVIATSFSVPGSWYQSILPLEFTTGNYVEALGHSMTVSSIRNSLFYSVLAVMFNAVIGIAIAYVVVRSDIPFRGALDSLAMLPLAVPGLVMAFGYLAISSHFSNLDWVKEQPFWQNLLDVRTNPTLFLVIAYAIRRLPYMVRSAVAGLQQTSVTLEEAAANLGANLWTTLRRITIPLIMANLIAGGLLAFSFSMLEVSDSLMLAQREDFYPITKTIYELFQLIGTGKYIASALGVWAMMFLTVTIIGSSLILGRKLGAIFRV